MVILLTRTATDHALCTSSSVLPVDKILSKGKMLKNLCRYKCDEEKFADVLMITKITAQDPSEIWVKAIVDRQFVFVAMELSRNS